MSSIPEPLTEFISSQGIFGPHDPKLPEVTREWATRVGSPIATPVIALADEINVVRGGPPQYLARMLGLSNQLGASVSAEIRDVAWRVDSPAALRMVHLFVLAMGFRGDLERSHHRDEAAELYVQLARRDRTVLPPITRAPEPHNVPGHTARPIQLLVAALLLALMGAFFAIVASSSITSALRGHSS